uniref:EamA domain-containing protein n=1 Tax=Cereibacter sphaeroides (strain ATCC 17025 / ATH 2.4.3) TaxID=349102 RepID=A4X0P1_CERS5
MAMPDCPLETGASSGGPRSEWGFSLSPLSYILVLAALTGGTPLSLVAPLREMSMMVGVLMGMLILREAVGLWRLVGCGVLIAGVILLSSS